MLRRESLGRKNKCIMAKHWAKDLTKPESIWFQFRHPDTKRRVLSRKELFVRVVCKKCGTSKDVLLTQGEERYVLYPEIACLVFQDKWTVLSMEDKNLIALRLCSVCSEEEEDVP